MARKTDGGKREEIVTAAARLFMTGGFDGTSVREIMNEAGGEAGLFYYYFRNKDEGFDSVLDRRLLRVYGERDPAFSRKVFGQYSQDSPMGYTRAHTDDYRTVS